MNLQLKKHILLASILSIFWSGFVLYSYFRQTDREQLITKEMHNYAFHVGEKIIEVFNWFEDSKPVFVPFAQSGMDTPLPNTVIQGSNGMALAMAVPITLAKRLEERTQNGVKIRFVSNTPLNPAHLPSSSVNNLIMKSIESDSDDFFGFREDVGLYSYVHPLTATKNCISCHTSLDEGGLIGAMVIDINKNEFFNAERTSNYQYLIANAIASFIIVLILYFIIVDMWRRHRAQSSSAQQAQAIATNMSQEIELVLGNMGHILNELRQDANDSKKEALVQSLQAINKSLLDTSFKLQAGENSTQHSDEEVFNVEELFENCAQIFYPQCLEKQITLDVNVDVSVPTYLLGNTHYLRQAVGRLLKNSVMYTRKGSVKLRVRSAVDMPSRFHMKNLNNLPIHLIIEVEDTSNGFVVTDNQSLLKSFAASVSRGSRATSRPVISLAAINDLAEFLDGSVKTLHNTKNGACFKLVVQMKMLEENQGVGLQVNHELSMSQIDHKSVREAKKEAQENMLNSLSFPVKQGAPRVDNQDVIQASALLATDDPISVLIVYAGVISNEDKATLKKEKINVTQMSTASQVLETITNPYHGYSIVFIHSAVDVDMFYLATRIRYAEGPDAKPVAIVIIADDIVRTDMDVMRFFNVSTVDNFQKDPHILAKIARLVMQTSSNKIFQGGNFLDKTAMDENSTKIFDMQKALENAKNDKQLLRSICSMWIRFYPRQVERLQAIIDEGDTEEIIRFLRSIKNSASTVCLPMLWAEANRLEKLVSTGKTVRYEKLFSIYEKCFKHLKNGFEVKDNTQKVSESKVLPITGAIQ